MSFTLGTSPIFFVNPDDRVAGNNNSFSFKINLPPNNNYDRVALLQCKIPKTYYLIRPRLNFFLLREITTRTRINIPVGNYTISAFRATLETLLNQASITSGLNWTYAVSYPNEQTEVNTGKFTFTVAGNAGNQPRLIIRDNSIAKPIGFNTNTSNRFINDTLTSTNVINLQAEHTVYIRSDVCRNGDNSDILQEIDTSVKFFEEIVYQTTDVEANAKEITTNKHNVYKFHLTDARGREVDLNGNNWSFSLLFYKHNDTDFINRKVIQLDQMEKLHTNK